jgi:hypothetical protein
MSAFGPQQILVLALRMSAFGQSDMAYFGVNVRLWPKADMLWGQNYL